MLVSSITDWLAVTSSDMNIGWVNPTHALGWVGLGYIFIFCFENDGYKFYNCMNLSQTCANGAQIANEANTFTS